MVDSIHASAVVLGEHAVLIQGTSGAGKSCLVDRLMFDANSRGHYAALVGDDRAVLQASGGRLIVAPHPVLAGLIERRGWGLVAIEDHIPSAVLKLVVWLNMEAPRFPNAKDEVVVMKGVELPCIILPYQADISILSQRILAYLLLD